MTIAILNLVVAIFNGMLTHYHYNLKNYKLAVIDAFLCGAGLMSGIYLLSI